MDRELSSTFSWLFIGPFHILSSKTLLIKSVRAKRWIKLQAISRTWPPACFNTCWLTRVQTLANYFLSSWNTYALSLKVL